MTTMTAQQLKNHIPVCLTVRLNDQKLERIKKERDKIFKDLEAHYNRERVSPQGRRTARWGEGGGMRRRPYGGIWKH